jgi:hypothetical protein
MLWLRQPTHHYPYDCSSEQLYPNLFHPSTLCHKLRPNEQWTLLTRRPGSLRPADSLFGNTCSRIHRLRTASPGSSRKEPGSAEPRVLSSTTLEISPSVIGGISRSGILIKLEPDEQSPPPIRQCLDPPSSSAPLAPRELMPLTRTLHSGLRHRVS